MNLKRLWSTILLIVVAVNCFAGVSEVISAIKKQSNCNIRLYVKKVVNWDPYEVAENFNMFNFTPFGFNLNDDRIFSIQEDETNWGLSGSDVSCRVAHTDNTGIFYFIYEAKQYGSLAPQVAIACAENYDAYPRLFIKKANNTAFDSDNTVIYSIVAYAVIGKSGDVLQQLMFLDERAAKMDFKSIMDKIADSLDSL